MAEDPICHHCRQRAAVLWCDYRIGIERRPEQVPLQIDDIDYSTIIGPPYMTAAEFARLCLDIESEREVETCDAAACAECAARYGWRRLGHICGDHGCDTVDHCPAHAAHDVHPKIRLMSTGDVTTERRRAHAINARLTFTVR